MIVELIKFPRSRSICEISPKTKPNSTRFKCTAINSAIACINKVDIKLTGLTTAKFKKGLSKVKMNKKASKEILKYLNKSIERKVRPIINKKYPGARAHRNIEVILFYEDLRNLYDPPDEYTIEEGMKEMEDHLDSLLN